MSTQIDERIVEMRFDNRDFEQNVQTSLSTLERLKSSLNLNGAAKGLDAVSKSSKNMKFDGIASGVESLQNRFSVLGIVGMRAIENITDSVMRLGSKSISWLTNGVIKGGIKRAFNLENARFQLQGLLSDEKKVEAVMKNVNDAVDGTAYSLDAAANVASQLAASSIGAGKKMENSLKAVAGVAAMTNSSYEDIGSVFTKIAGQGRVMADDLNRLSARGMNAAATLAKHLGTTEANVRDMVSKGKVSFSMFAEAMNDAFGKHAKKANETFNGALSNIQAALGRIGADFIAPIIKQNGPIVQLLNRVREIVNEIHTLTKPVAEKFGETINSAATTITKLLGNSKWAQLTERMKEAGLPLSTFQKELAKVTKSHGESLDEMIKKEGSFSKVLENGSISKMDVIKTLVNINNNYKKNVKSAEAYNDKLKYFQKVVSEVWHGDYKNGEARVKALTKAGYKYAEVQALVNKTVDGHKLTLKDLSKEQLASVGYTKKEIEAIQKLTDEATNGNSELNKIIDSLGYGTTATMMIKSLANAIKAIVKPLNQIRIAWMDVFGNRFSIDIISDLATRLEKFTDSLIMSKDSAKNVHDTFQGLFIVFDYLSGLVFKLVHSGFTILDNVLRNFNTSILALTGNIGRAIIKFDAWLKSENKLGRSLQFIADIITIVIRGLKGVASAVVNLKIVQSTLSKLEKTFKNMVNKVFDKFDIDIRIANIKSIKWSAAGTVIKKGLIRFFELMINGIQNFDAEKFMAKFLNISKWIIDGLVVGIQTALPKIKEIISVVANTAISTICNILGIHSPSTVFIKIGGFIISGLCIGMLAQSGQVKSAISKIASFISSNELLKGLSDLGGTLINTVVKVLNAVSVLIGKFADGLSNMTIDVNSLVVFGLLVSMLLLVKQALDIADKLVSPAAAFNKLLRTITGSIETFTKNAKIIAAVEIIKATSKAIAIIAAAVYMLGKMEGSDLRHGLEAVAVIGAIIAGLVWVAGKADVKEIAGLGSFVAAFAFLLITLTGCIKRLSSLKLEEAAIGVGSIVIFMLAVMGLVAVIGKAMKGVEATNIKALETFLLSLSGSLLLIAIALKITEGVSQHSVNMLAEVLGGLIVLFAIIKALTKDATRIGNTGLDSTATIILELATSLLLIAKATKTIADLSTDDLKKAGTYITALAGLFVIVQKVTSTKFTKLKSIDGIVSNGAFLEFAAALLILSFAVKRIAALSLGEIGKAIVYTSAFGVLLIAFKALDNIANGIGLVGKSSAFARTAIGLSIALLLMVGVVKLCNTISLADIGNASIKILAFITLMLFFTNMTEAGENIDKAGTAVMKMSVAILLLTGCVMALSLLDFGKAAQGIGVISILIILMSVLTYNASKLKTDVSKQFITMTACIVALAAMVALLATLDPVAVAVATGCLIGIMVMFTIMSNMAGTAKMAKSSIVMVTLAIVAIGAVIWLIGSLPIENAIAASVSIAVLLIAMTASLAIMSAVGPAATMALVGIGVMTLVVMALAAVLFAMSALDVQNALTNSKAIALLLGVMTVCLLACAAIGAVAEFAIVGAALLLAFAVAMGTVVTAFLAIYAKTNLLTDLGKRLTGLMEGLGPFLDAVNAIKPGTAKSMLILADSIAVLTASSFLDGISKFLIGQDLSTFAKKLTPLAEGLKSFDDTTKDIKAKHLNNVVDAVKTLCEANDLISGITFGDLSSFGTSINTFTDDLKAFNNKIVEANLDTKAIKSAANACKALAELQAALPRETMFTTVEGLDTFGNSLAGLGQGLADFQSSLPEEMNSKKISDASAVLKSLAEINEYMPKLNTFTGSLKTMSLGTFSKQLPKLGTGLSNFNNNLPEEMDTKKITAAAEALKAIAELGTALPKRDILGNLKNMSFKDFSSQLKSLATGISNFSANLTFKEGAEEKIAQASKLMKAIATFQASMPEKNALGDNKQQLVTNLSDSLGNIATGLNDFMSKMDSIDLDKVATYSEKIDAVTATYKKAGETKVDLSNFKPGLLGKKMTTFYEQVKGIDTEGMNKATKSLNKIIKAIKSCADIDPNAINNLDAACKKLANIDLSGAISNLNNAGSQLSSAGSKVASKLSKTASAVTKAAKSVTKVASSSMGNVDTSSAKSSGTKLGKAMASGLQSSASAVTKAAKNVVIKTFNSVKNSNKKFISIGENISKGMAIGINKKLGLVRNKVKQLVNEAAKATRAAAIIKSPSRLFMGIGEYISLGFAKGIEKRTDAVITSSVDMVSSAVNMARSKSTELANIISSEFSADPVISPVLDLSNVSAGAGKISDIIDTESVIGIAANARIINTAMLNRIDSNQYVVSAINKLGKQLSNISGGDTYNIDGITYDDGSNITDAVKTLVHAAKIERRI